VEFLRFWRHQQIVTYLLTYCTLCTRLNEDILIIRLLVKLPLPEYVSKANGYTQRKQHQTVLTTVCACVCVCGYLAAKFVTDAGRLRDLARSREIPRELLMSRAATALIGRIMCRITVGRATRAGTDPVHGNVIGIRQRSLFTTSSRLLTSQLSLSICSSVCLLREISGICQIGSLFRRNFELWRIPVITGAILTLSILATF